MKINFGNQWIDCWIRPSPGCAGLWCGQQIPDGVFTISVWRDLDDQLLVSWRAKGSLDTQQMPFTPSAEGVQAALVAMKLTC